MLGDLRRPPLRYGLRLYSPGLGDPFLQKGIIITTENASLKIHRVRWQLGARQRLRLEGMVSYWKRNMEFKASTHLHKCTRQGGN